MAHQTPLTAGSRETAPHAASDRVPFLILAALMLAFTLWFSVYSMRLHDAHLTHKADLGQMDLAIWNTTHGRPLYEVKNDQASTRLTDHAEPIFLPISLVFWLWDDVRALLVLQAAVLALGAWPIFLLARRRLRGVGFGLEAEVGGLAFAAAYLLAGALQAAAVSDFHAMPFAAPLIGWSLYAVETRRWGRFALAAILLMSVQEGTALLAAVMGLYVLLRFLPWERMRSLGLLGGRTTRPGPVDWLGLAVGAGILLLGLAWFYVATFVIIPHFAAQAYNIGQSPYAARYGELGDSFGDVIKAILTRPRLVLRIILEPLRFGYLVGLLTPVAFLALLAPEILLLSAPLLLANLLSTFAFQYSGQLHYSAPLVPYFVAAGAIGLARLLRMIRKASLRRTLLAAGLALVLAGAIGNQAYAGYTPLGREFWRLVPGGMPQITPHDRLLARFVTQIPHDAAVSATADLYPHLSHRELMYLFPWQGQATLALVDVSGTTDRHPADVLATVQKWLANGWGVVDAADGYLLLAKGRGQREIPNAFYDFARAPAAQPQYRLDITFDDAVELIGYDVLDDPKWRRTGLRYYWRARSPMTGDTRLSVQVVTPDGTVIDDTAQRPMPALTWYPPERWQPGEIVVTESKPWYMPGTWAPLITVSTAGQVLPAATGPGNPEGVVDISPEGSARLQAWQRKGGVLKAFDAPQTILPAAAKFAGDGWSVQLDGISMAKSAAPGGALPVSLQWRSKALEPPQREYTVFVHLQNAAGETVANADATPIWFTARPTSGWQAKGGAPFVSWDTHELVLPPDLPAGDYRLVAGWYYWVTGDRLPRVDAAGNPAGDEVVLGVLTVDPRAAPAADLSCLLVPQSCASQEP